ncbi:MAG: hypothetical protein K0S41_2687 [Anaerocolumna sp.]|jgi:hypothetical protein|nr:hypothetical protein [Anaerocolumna sp.]
MKNEMLPKKIFCLIFSLYLIVLGGISIWNSRSAIVSIVNTINISRMAEMTSSFENSINKNFAFHKYFINIDGMEKRILNKYVIEDVSETVVKDLQGQLNFISEEAKELEKKVSAIQNLDYYCSDKNIPFLYIQVPFKADANKEYLPIGIKDYSRENADNFLNELKLLKMDSIDLRKELNIKFFNTDHHWTIESAFEASQLIAQLLIEKYGFHDLDPEEIIADSNNYTIDTIKNCYLGSQGKRTGTLYSGYDDFTYITPNFLTSYSYEHVVGDESVLYKEGSFEEALISDALETEYTPEYYSSYLNNSYCEMIIKNHNAYNEKKIFIIADSFGRPFSAFLSLYFSESVVVDTQKGRFKKDIYQYIDMYKPDIVITLFNSGMYNDESVFNFYNKSN